MNIIHGGLKYERGTRTYSHGPTDNAKTLKTWFGVGDVDLSERRGTRYTRSLSGGREMRQKTHRASRVATYIVLDVDE